MHVLTLDGLVIVLSLLNLIMLKQQLQQKLQQKLSPQQIQLIRLLELPAIELEERIKHELEDNPALEEGKEIADDFDRTDEGGEELAANEMEGESETDTDLSLGDYMSEDDIPDYKLRELNELLFNTILRESIGKYNKYIVMNFDNEKFSTVLNKINPSRLLLLDFGKFEKEKYSYICQDFDEFFYQALNLLKERLKNYHQLVFLFPKSLKHPQSSKVYFTRFCQEQGFLCEIQEDIENLIVRKGVAYIAIKQQDVVKVVKQGRLEGLKCGKDFGLLAYNDIPSYEVIDEGITSLSIDWEMMGNEAANFVLNNVPVQKFLPTEVRLRKSL